MLNMERQPVPPTCLAAHYLTDSVARICISDGNDGTSTCIGIYHWRGANYIRGSDIWGKQTGCRRGCWVRQGCLVLVHDYLTLEKEDSIEGGVLFQ